MKKKKILHKQKVCYICKKGFSTDDDNKTYCKVKDHCHFTGQNLKDNLNVWEKIQKNILIKNLIMVNQLHTITRQAHYQVLLIIYLKDFIVISARVANLVLTRCFSRIIN